jgi:hypothetical protein
MTVVLWESALVSPVSTSISHLGTHNGASHHSGNSEKPETLCVDRLHAQLVLRETLIPVIAVRVWPVQTSNA